MYPQILAIPGSPIKNSNTDRLVQAVLAASGQIRVRQAQPHQVRPCIACLVRQYLQVKTISRLAKSRRRGPGGGATAHGSVDAFTKAFLDAFPAPPARPQSRQLAAVVTTGIGLGARGGGPTPRSPMP